MTNLIVSGFTSNAALRGARISSPFSLYTCSAQYINGISPTAGGMTLTVYPYIKVCGAFLTLDDAMLVQPWVSTVGVYGWRDYITGGGPGCNAELAGYTISSFVSGMYYDIIGPSSGSCMSGNVSQSCTLFDPPSPMAPSPSPMGQRSKPPPSPLPPALPPPSTPSAPPTPPGLVKTHNCVQSTSNVPYNISTLFTVNTRDQSNAAATAMCFVVGKQSCRASSYCCSMDFAKVEVPISESCKGDLRGITINSSPVSYSWGLYDSLNVTTIKFTKLTTYLPNPDQAVLCWLVRPGVCSTPEQFCHNGLCQVNVFSTDNKCCPATIAN
ncbi:hypothetical protein Agub_g11014 [Astrephomene gubernaculifera]|uniref:Pherophorin domain-containing protein n=1 Tax=Astrephomene gubernaculifera TaxID=47775 RepID=A0AAD3HQK5_9CHLO|nr:hypothetical protein Agub_g11014 [Astrephomene gubernaculifera]